MSNTPAQRHTVLLEMIGDYLTAKNKSARWLGIVVASDPRMVPNLRRGQTYPPMVMLALLNRLLPFLAEEAEQEAAHERACSPLPLAA